jgi:hypothetical protein
MAGPPKKSPPVKREPPILNLPRGNQSLRDLEDPTHAFPIGGRGKAPKSLANSDEFLLLNDPPITAADEDDGDYPDTPPRATPQIDARLVAVWLVLATVLSILAALAAAAAVVYL